jgi:hypothetical protein
MMPRIAHVGKMTDGRVGMYLGDEFLLVQVKEKCVLGRGIAADYSQPTVDLSKFAALEKGVSRIHCALTWQGNALTVEDLKSSNGTWLNSVRLIPFKPYPLESGEMVLLGKLDIWVYYR